MSSTVGIILIVCVSVLSLSIIYLGYQLSRYLSRNRTKGNPDPDETDKRARAVLTMTARAKDRPTLEVEYGEANINSSENEIVNFSESTEKVRTEKFLNSSLI